MAMKRILYLGSYWHETLMAGIAHEAATREWHLNLEMPLQGSIPRAWRGDGILTTLGMDLNAFLMFWKDAACPAVSLSLNSIEIDIPRVGIDNKKAGGLAAEHFLQRGFSSFAFVGRSREHSGTQRLDSFAARLREADKSFEPTLTVLSDEQGQRLGWLERQNRIKAMLEPAVKPLGVFALDDMVAVEIIEACQAESWRVPQDVAVLGMLDIPLFRNSTTIPMSSITVDFDEHARVACDLLADLIAGKSWPAEPILLPPTGLVVRQSTDTLAARLPAVIRALTFMTEQYTQQIDIRDIVKASGISQTQLYSEFKKDLGTTPVALLTRIRLDHAKRQLAHTNAKIEVVSHDCGFGDRINLYRLFKQHVGLSPGQYRKQVRHSRK